jgi:hypothetical protein
MYLSCELGPVPLGTAVEPSLRGLCCAIVDASPLCKRVVVIEDVTRYEESVLVRHSRLNMCEDHMNYLLIEDCPARSIRPEAHRPTHDDHMLETADQLSLYHFMSTSTT